MYQERTRPCVIFTSQFSRERKKRRLNHKDGERSRLVAVRRLVLFAWLLVFAPLARGQSTWYVDANGISPGTGTLLDPYTEIQYALDQLSTVDGDTVLVVPGTYTEFVNFSGKAVHLLGQAGPGSTVIDVSGMVAANASVVTFSSNEGVGSILEGFTVRGGSGSLDPVSYALRGGGILAMSASPRVINCWIESNTADEGGGVYAENSSIEVHDCLIRFNFASMLTGGGGACLVDCDALVTGTDINSNTSGSWGGGVSVDGGQLNVVYGSIDGNLAQYFPGGNVAMRDFADATFANVDVCNGIANEDGGGGFYVEQSTLALQDCRVSGNVSNNVHLGGAIFAVAGLITIERGSFEGNEATRGGAIGTFGATVSATETAFVGNRAEPWPGVAGGQGGAIFTAGLGIELHRCTLENNVSPSTFLYPGEGGAVFGPVLLEQCTLVGNEASLGIVDSGANLNSCILWGNNGIPLVRGSTATWSDVQGGAPGVGNINQDPLFWDSVGGDYHLTSGSPCIDSGDPAGPLDSDGSRADMGALAYDPNWCPTAVTTYCTAKASSAGCSASISSLLPSNAPVSGAADYSVLVSSVQGLKSGLIFFGHNGTAAIPFWGGTLCLQPPLGRGPIQFSGGSNQTSCDGQLVQIINDGSAFDPGSGGTAWFQAWYRDPQNGIGSFGTALSNALSLSYK